KADSIFIFLGFLFLGCLLFILRPLIAFKKEESTLEGTSVTLSYKYPKLSTSDYFFWYLQFPGKPPEFFFSHLGSKATLQSLDPRFSHKVKDDDKMINLQISSAAVTDSAVYYCAVRPTHSDPKCRRGCTKT
uniref:Immunoglobulin V-set domain-containing protein n=1 Tax=Oryzias latipes TaxID=8090 RepID=A0A3B3H6W0_ORYLA